MSSVSARHIQLSQYFITLMNAYFTHNPVGQVISAPFVMCLDAVNANHEPDLQVILGENQTNITPASMNGPADIVIEIVSSDSADEDYGAKMLHYEAGGVREYWLIDPLRNRAVFNRLEADGLYQLQPTDPNGFYRTPLLPGFGLPVAALWVDALPNFDEIREHVRREWERRV